MEPEELKLLLRKSPFEPFRLHMGNGRTADVRHPEMIAVGDYAVAVAIEVDGRQLMHNFSILNINEIEPLPAATE